MNPAGRARSDLLPRVARIARARRRLLVAVAFGLVVWLVLPSDWMPMTRVLMDGIRILLISWPLTTSSAGAASSSCARGPRARTRAVGHPGADRGGGAVQPRRDLVSAGRGPGRPDPQSAAPAAWAVTIFLSWASIHTIFALHYAHEYYSGGRRSGGLGFPGGGEPDYWDFV